MLRSLNLSLVVSVLTCSSFVGSDCSFAQPIWLDRSHDKAISLEILKPDFDWDSNITFTTSAWFLSGRFVGRDNISVVGEIPFAHYGYDSELRDRSDNAFGNPYLGIEFYVEDSPVFGEIGFRLPLSPEFDNDAAAVGFYTDPVDRAEAFVPHVLPISGFVNYLKKEPSGFFSRFRCGPTFWIATEERDESEWFLLYSAQAGYESTQASFLAGFSGRYDLSEQGGFLPGFSGPDADFGERTLHQFGLAVNFTFGEIQPGISLKVPLDEDLDEWLDFVFGLTLGIPMI